MPRNNFNLQMFEITLRHAEFASEQLWQIFHIFLLAQSIFLAALSITFKEQNNFYFLIVIVGFVTCILWLAAYLRTRNYYDFRIGQAAKIEPKELDLLKQGKIFAEGGCVDFPPYRMNSIARWLRMNRSIPIFIILFILLYSILGLNYLGIIHFLK